MSRLVAKILLTIMLFPLAAMFNFVSYLVVNHYCQTRDVNDIRIASSLTIAFIITYWILLWRSSVVWTKRRVRWSFLCFGIAAWGAAAIGFVMWEVEGQDTANYTGLTALPLLWLTSTIFVWRETRDERAARISRAGANAVTCPTCGYNLTGLSETRCPECGTKFTIDELLALQPSRAGVELETT